MGALAVMQVHVAQIKGGTLCSESVSLTSTYVERQPFHNSIARTPSPIHWKRLETCTWTSTKLLLADVKWRDTDIDSRQNIQSACSSWSQTNIPPHLEYRILNSKQFESGNAGAIKTSAVLFWRPWSVTQPQGCSCPLWDYRSFRLIIGTEVCREGT